MRSVDLNLKLEIVDKPVVLLTAPGYTHTFTEEWKHTA